MQEKLGINSKYSFWIVYVCRKLNANMPVKFCESADPNQHCLPVTQDFELILSCEMNRLLENDKYMKK